MGPTLDPGQRLFAAWVLHHVRHQLHLVDAHLGALGAEPLSPAQRREAAAIQGLLRALLAGLEDLLAGVS